MDFIPLLPVADATPGPRKISPTDISQYIRLDQCRRYLRLRLHERAHGRRFPTSYGVAPQSIPPILTLSGASLEQQVEAAAAAHAVAAVNCKAAALAGDDEFFGPDHNALVIERARALPPGGDLLLFQPRLRVAIGPWELRGDVDILRLERDAAGDLRALIVDMKRSTAAKVEHRLQVAFYHEMLDELFAAAGLPVAEIATGILYRGPADGAESADPVEQARREAQRAAAAQRFGVTDAFFEQVADPDAYRDEVQALVTGESTLAAEVAAAPFEELGFHLRLHSHGGRELEGVRAVKAELEACLRSVMARTERLGASPDRDGMLKEITSGPQLEAKDLQAYLAFQRVARERQAFNSPFWPFVLATTSLGQEGLDFHTYCHAIVHWNLPANPVDLEQREGRIHRFKGHAVRKNLVERYGHRDFVGLLGDPWETLFERASRRRSAGDLDLVPYWVFPGSARIERHVPALPLSRDRDRLEALRRTLTLYRMVFGQNRQEDLLAYLMANLDDAQVATVVREPCISLEPPHRTAPIRPISAASAAAILPLPTRTLP